MAQRETAAHRVVIIDLTAAQGRVAGVAIRLDFLPEPLPPTDGTGSGCTDRQFQRDLRLSEVPVRIAPESSAARIAIRFRRDAALCIDIQYTCPPFQRAGRATQSGKQAGGGQIGVEPPVAGGLAEGQGAKARHRQCALRLVGGGQRERHATKRHHAGSREIFQAIRPSLCHRDAACLPRGQVHHAGHGIGAIFDGASTLAHRKPADQACRDQPDINPAIPRHSQRRTIQKHQGLPLIAAAHPRHCLAPRVGAHRNAGQAAQRVGNAARLPIEQGFARQAHHGRGHPSRPGGRCNGDQGFFRQTRISGLRCCCRCRQQQRSKFTPHRFLPGKARLRKSPKYRAPTRPRPSAVIWPPVGTMST